MIIIRTDDVMVNSEQFPHDRAVNRFKHLHEQVMRLPKGMLHVPTIIVTEIQAYPELIEYIRNETEAGHMFPQLHGYEHIDYRLPLEIICEHLYKSLLWFHEKLGFEPTLWAVPWGQTDKNVNEAARINFLNIETTDDTIDVSEAVKLTKRNGTLNIINTHTVLVHWWEKGHDLERLVEVGVHGTYKEAVVAAPKIFK